MTNLEPPKVGDLTGVVGTVERGLHASFWCLVFHNKPPAFGGPARRFVDVSDQVLGGLLAPGKDAVEIRTDELALEGSGDL